MNNLQFEDTEEINDAESDMISGNDIEQEARRLELNIKKENLENSRQDREERKRYANKVYWLVFLYLFSVLAIVVFYNCMLSDTVLVTLLTTSSANVIAVFIIVMRYLFRK